MQLEPMLAATFVFVLRPFACQNVSGQEVDDALFSCCRGSCPKVPSIVLNQISPGHPIDLYVLLCFFFLFAPVKCLRRHAYKVFGFLIAIDMDPPKAKNKAPTIP